MSHELRTPLNSLLLLAQQLAGNQPKTLNPKQIEYAQTIAASGNDLLNLINEILDLSKIESGTVTVDPSDVAPDDMRNFVEQTFRHVAQSQKLEFEILLDPGLPKTLFTDEKRLKQIVKNLLANAFKFTASGRVTFAIAPAKSGWTPGQPVLDRARTVVAFTVRDTGIGVHPEKHKAIFEAFQQADGTTSRKYGGTGLGLAISRELARLLGGQIRLESALGEGATFVLYMPAQYVEGPSREGLDRSGETEVMTLGEALEISKATNRTRYAEDELAEPSPAVAVLELPPARTAQNGEVPFMAERSTMPVSADTTRLVDQLPDDRSNIQATDRVVLIVDDERYFAQTLLELAHERGYKGIIALDGEAAIRLAREHLPTAITLDVHLPDVSGWAVLDQLKNDAATRPHSGLHYFRRRRYRSR